MFLAFSPQASRLRRVARACAAGEVTRREYRQARRALIRHMQGSDDTLDRTERRSAPAVREPDAHPRQQPRPWLRAWQLWLVVALVGSLVPVFALAVNIPTPDARDPSPQRSLRVPVERLEWTLPGGTPELQQQAVDTFLAAQLHSMQQRNQVAEHGFTEAELQQVGRLLNALGVHDPGTTLTARDVRDLAALIQDQKQQRGISVVQLEEIALATQQWVRAQGFPLATAYVPAQPVKDGLVRIDVQIGVLSDIQIAQRTGMAALRQPWLGEADSTWGLEHLLGQPVRRNQIESRLNVLNRSPHRSLQAGFRPGAEVGDSALILQVNDRARLGWFVQADNHGSEQVGSERLSGGLQAADLLFAGDSIDIAISQGLTEREQTFGTLSYSGPLDPGRRDLQLTLGFTEVAIDESASGEGRLVELMLEDAPLFRRERGLQAQVGGGLHDVRVQVRGQQEAEETTWYGFGGFSGHALFDRQQVALDGDARLFAGRYEALGTGRDNDFWMLRARASVWTPLSLPTGWAGFETRPEARLIVRARAQTGSDDLPASLRFAAVEPEVHGGLPVGALQLDAAAGLNTAVRVATQRGDFWLFGDLVYGERNPESAYYHLATLGLGWESRFDAGGDGRLHSRMTLGYPVSHKSNGVLDNDGIQLFWSLRYQH